MGEREREREKEREREREQTLLLPSIEVVDFPFYGAIADIEHRDPDRHFQDHKV